MELTERISAVVTGGASGLGLGVVRHLRSFGVKVVLFDLNEEQGEAVASETGAIFIPVDVSDRESVEAGFKQSRQKQGQESILANCAGIAVAGKTVSRGKPHDSEIYEKVLKINLFGSFLCSSIAATGMASNTKLTDDGETGVIVLTASVAAYDGQIGQVAYSSSKGGIVGMTLPMARDLSALGIRVMTIAPGIFDTPMLQAMPDEVRRALAAQVPFPSRLGRAKDYALLVEHICRNEMLNGEVIRLDGSIRMAPR